MNTEAIEEAVNDALDKAWHGVWAVNEELYPLSHDTGLYQEEFENLAKIRDLLDRIRNSFNEKILGKEKPEDECLDLRHETEKEEESAVGAVNAIVCEDDDVWVTGGWKTKESIAELDHLVDNSIEVYEDDTMWGETLEERFPLDTPIQKALDDVEAQYRQTADPRKRPYKLRAVRREKGKAIDSQTQTRTFTID